MTDKINIKLKKLIDRVKASSFIKSVMTLSAGVVVSQSIALITTPVISRIYDPSVLGDFSIITSDMTIIGVIVCLGLMTAIMIPKEDSEARGICRLLFACIAVLSTVLLGLAIMLSSSWTLFTVSIDYKLACLILYVYIILSNLSSLLYSYINRQKMYKVLFWNPTLGTATNAIVSIGLGLLKCGLWGYALGNILACVVLVVHMLLNANPFTREKDEKRIPINLLKKYIDFPLYQLPSNLIGTVSQQLPNQLIKSFYGSGILGSYSMCLTILGLPSKFLAGPINRVYYREATERYNNGENIGEFSYRILKANIKIAIIPICVLIVFGPQLFSFILGKKWLEAGALASILGAYQLVAFCNSCLSGKFIIIKRQKIILILNICILVIVFAVFYSSQILSLNILQSIMLYSVCGACFELTDLTIFMRKTGFKLIEFFKFVLLYLLLPILISNAVRYALFNSYFS